MILRPTVVAALALVCGACASGGAVPRPFPGAGVPPRGDAPVTAETPTPQPPPTVQTVPPAAQTPTPGPNGAAPSPSVPTPNPIRAELVATALSFRGVPYKNGGSDPSGFDCSGFVQYVFARHEWSLPRDTDRQYHEGNAVAFDDIQPGDLVFFETVGQGATHVGVAIGGDQFIHAPSSRGAVRIERYTGTYWLTRFIGARRIVDSRQ